MADISINRHSSIRIAGEKVLYFDPWEVKEHHDADHIFVTHEHFDHFSPADIEKLKKDSTVLIAPASMEAAARECGLPLLTVEPGKDYEVQGIRFSAVPAYNIVNTQFHAKERGWCGYAVTMENETFYVTGDSEFIPEMEGVPCDVLLLPVGGTYTMTAKEAAQCAKTVHPRRAIPTHYGCIVGEKKDGERFKALLASIAPEIRVELKI